MATNSRFDTAGFYQAIDAVRQKRGVSWNRVMRDTGVAACHIPSQMRRSAPNRENRLALATWAGIDASDFERKVVGNA